MTRLRWICRAGVVVAGVTIGSDTSRVAPGWRAVRVARQ